MAIAAPSALKLLVVDADAAQRARTTKILSATGIAAQIDTEGEAGVALNLLLEGRHDLCLLDAAMQAPGGIDLLTTLRDLGSKTPVILLLDPEADCGEECVPEIGAQDALYKDGLLPSALRRSIRQVVAKARIQGQLETSQAQLRRHELELERLQTALDEHAIVSVADPQGNITYVNSKFCEISGYAREELLGRNHRLLKSGRHAQAFYEGMWRTLASGQTWHGEVCNRRKDGSHYWVRGTIVPFLDEAGLPSQYVSIRTDVTAIKEAETRLRLMGKALEASVDGIAIADARQPDTPLIYVNPAFSRLTGYAQEEAVGRNCRFLQGDERDQFGLQEIRAGLREGRPARALLRNFRKDGSLFWNDLSITPVHDENGVISHFVGVANDVTARQDAERALRRSEERLRRSQEYANIGTWDWNIRTGELFWSERIGPLFGYDGLTETSYENFLKAVHPDDRQSVIEAVNACVERGEKYDIEHRCVWPDGTVRWLLERGDVTRDLQGEPLHMLGVVQDITERKMAEQKLQASEASLANAQRIAHLGNWDYDLASGQIIWSPEVYRIFGHDPASISPNIRTYYEWVHPDDRDLVRETEARTAREGRGEVVHRIVRPDGGIRYVRLLGEVVADKQGQALRMTGTVQDITTLKQAEEAMRQSERNLAMAQRVAHLGSFDWNPVSGELHWSEEHYRLWGLEPGAVTPSYAVFQQGVHPDDLAMLETTLRAALDGGRFYDCVHRVRRPDGSERTIHGLGEVMFDDAGQAVRMIGTVQDVTELKLAEKLIHDSRERFRTLVETTLDWIWEVDAEARYTYASPRVCDLLGYAPEEVLGKTPFELMPPAEAQRVLEAFAPIAEARQVFNNLINRNTRKDGQEVVLETSGVPVFGEDGSFLGYRGIDRDITERIERERQLVAAKVEADRANQAKSMFLSSMSHELRTPMNAILGFAQLLQMQRGLDAPQLENVEEILKAGRHLLELINEVLDLAKIDAGGLALHLEPVGCCDLVRESLNLVRSMAERFGIGLREDFQSCPVLFLADPTRLKQVVINLLSNAIKYNRPAGSVTLRLMPGAQGYGRLEVVDTGLGMSAEQQQELFQPFHRLSAPEANIEGHGIGLAISKRLVEAMHGRIGVLSTPGEASTFWLELPLATAEGAQAGLGGLRAQTAVPQDEGEHKAEATILYVEDNPANLRLVESLIATRPGWRLIAAQTPELGLERAAFEAVDLILLDINLPGMDGYQVMEHLQRLEKTRSIPVVALTASAMPEAVERGMAAGFRDYLTKPLEVGRFWACLDGILQEQSEGQTA